MKQIKVTTGDQYKLSATYFSPPHPAAHVILINPATGVKQSYYMSFAIWLSTHGFHVYTYDYRGIGASRPPSLKSLKTNLIEWAELDVAAMLRHAQREHPGHRISMIGHSLGGQLIGMLPAAVQLNGIILVASQTPYWKHYRGIMRAKVWLLWHVMIPVLTRVAGYFPASKLGLFEDLPGPVARQWARWGKNKNYLFDELPEKKNAFAALRQPALVYSFSDDPFAPPDAVHDLLRCYANLKIHHRHVSPSDIGRRSIGHFSFFRKEFENVFWVEVKQDLYPSPTIPSATHSATNLPGLLPPPGRFWRLLLTTPTTT